MQGSFLGALINLVFPPHPDVATAARAEAEDVLPLFALCREPTTGVYTALPYQNALVRSLVRANKYHNYSHAARLLGPFLGEALLGAVEERAADASWMRPLLIPIPTAPSRFRERGAHQVLSLVRNLPNEVAGAFEFADILRRRDRPSQVRVPKQKRMKNIADAFYIPPENTKLIRGKRAVVVDDVSETGATISDARRALLEAGAVEVIGVALAH